MTPGTLVHPVCSVLPHYLWVIAMATATGDLDRQRNAGVWSDRRLTVDRGDLTVPTGRNPRNRHTLWRSKDKEHHPGGQQEHYYRQGDLYYTCSHESVHHFLCKDLFDVLFRTLAYRFDVEGIDQHLQDVRGDERWQGRAKANAFDTQMKQRKEYRYRFLLVPREHH